LPSGVKIIKKYIFLRNLKKEYDFKFHANIYEMNELHSTIALTKLKNWDGPFLYRRLEPFFNLT